MVRRYRKKPVEIDAAQWWPELPAEAGEVLGWLGANGVDFMVTDNLGLNLPTLEGDMRADPGDWIIRGVKGEFYPCKPDIFEATYDAVALG